MDGNGKKVFENIAKTINVLLRSLTKFDYKMRISPMKVSLMFVLSPFPIPLCVLEFGKTKH